jgi:biotin carboxyl carrier protein
MSDSNLQHSVTKPEPAFAPPREPRSTWLAVLGGAAALALILWGVLALRSGGPATTANGASVAGNAGDSTATIAARDFVRSLRIHGTVEAVQFRAVAAPRLSGPGMGTMIITKLVAPGATVKPGDVLVEFDRQNQERNFLDRQAEFRDLEEQIKKRRADQDAARARDDTELKQSENDVAAAELELRRNEVISRIDAEKNQQNLEEAKARFQQLKETYNLKRTAAAADVRILEIQRDRARNAMQHAQENAQKLIIRSPLSGIVVFTPIGRPGGMGEVQEGDEVRPGTPFLQVVDPSAMQVRARVNQADVPFLRPGQSAQVRLDAYPDLVFSGKLERLAAIGITSSMNTKVRTFATTFSIEGTDPRLLPDLSAAVEIEIERRAGALVAPRDALISENGQTYLNVKRGIRFEKVAVKIIAMSDAEVVIEPGGRDAIAAGVLVARRM